MADDAGAAAGDAERLAARVERAMLEFRCGRVVRIDDGAGRPTWAIATELATERGVDALRALGEGSDPDVVLTHHRAETLKIRLYTPEAVRLPYPRWLDMEQVRRLADPQFDLSEPLRGPFEAGRAPVPDAFLAGISLAKAARLLPSALCVRPDAADRDDRDRSGIVAVRADEIAGYGAAASAALTQVAAAKVPLADCEDARLVIFRPGDGGPEHVAVVVGQPPPDGPALVRLHSQCFTGDLLGSLKCDCGDQLRGALRLFAGEGAGILLYLAQEGRGIGLANKLRAYALQDQGFDTVEANLRLGFEDDERDFLVAAEMLRRLGHHDVRLLTNNPRKVDQLQRAGITVSARVGHAFPSNTHNERYLAVKAEKSGHLLR